MKFKQLQPDDYADLKHFFMNQPYQLCEYSLPSLLAWNNPIYQLNGAVDGDALILYYDYPRKKELRHLMLPVSPTKEYTPRDLNDLAGDLEFKQYCFVPENYIHSFGEEKIKQYFHITEETEFNDYVYLKEDLADLKGNKFSKKRNLINQFKKEYLNHERVKLERITKNDASIIIDFLEEWCAQRNCEINPDEDLNCEKLAARATLENIDIIGADGLFVRIDEKVSAFGISSRLTDQMGTLSFEKAFPDIKGLYQYFDRQCARKLFEGYKYINKESDMDKPGIARSKRSYHPIMRVRSYKLTVK
jgi:uncharacterized protein